jgi:RNA polymerase sigma factor (TIGR02999 family)
MGENASRSENRVARSQDGLTDVLHRWNAGDRSAANEVFRLVYKELRGIAAAHSRRERPDHTLPTTAIVHEAYIKIFKQDEVHWQSTEQFLGTASRVMRQILIDHARRRTRSKRQASDDDRWAVLTCSPEEILEVDRGLEELAKIDKRKARALEAHLFAGMTVNETASYLGISRTTTVRELRLAKAWMYQRLAGSSHAD